MNSPYNGVLFVVVVVVQASWGLQEKKASQVFDNLWYQGVQRNYQWLQDTKGVLETMVLVLQNVEDI